MSTVPRLYRQERTAFMSSVNGDRTFATARDTYYTLTRVDANPFSKLHVYGTWQYNYDKLQGNALPNADDAAGIALNQSSSTAPDAFNYGIGYKAPNMILGVGGDWTPTPNIVVSSRWGRVYTNYKDIGTPSGIRYRIRNTTYPYNINLGGVDANTVGLDGVTTVASVCPECVQSAGFQSIGLNVATLHDKTWRSSWGNDFSYFHKGWGTHNFKVGYLYSQISNDAAVGAINFAQVYVSYICGNPAGCGPDPASGNGTPWSPTVSSTDCSPIVATNVANFPGNPLANSCRGNFGTVNIREGDETLGQASSSTHGLYVQDNWTVGHGVTLNLGIRFDKESVPTFKPGFPSINFDWTQKVAPRLGASWDVMRNGTLKVYGSFGYFFDIMKWDLPRGSFGGDYWHDCVYAMDSANFLTGFVPDRSGAGGTFCPAVGGAAGVVAGGRFIGNEDFRVPSNDPAGACDANLAIAGSCVASLLALEPTKQHEIVLGADWQIKPMLAFAARWSRKRLDRTIEDTGVIGPFGEQYSINNPGFGFNSIMYGALPAPITIQQARREYDGLEFRLTKAASTHWFGQFSYTYSKLRGNYSGLTATDIADGGGGRQGGDVSRAFDEPMGSYDAHGNIVDGPLATDRPHAFKAAGYYRLKWWKMETVFGGFQQLYSGSPLSSYLTGVFGMDVFPEGRGNWVNFTPGAINPAFNLPDFVKGSIIPGMRTPVFSQSDFSMVHEMHVSKNNENLKLGFEANFTNLFNQHSPTFINSAIQKNGIHPYDTPANLASKTVNYGFLLSGSYDYVAEMNGAGLDGRHDLINPLYGLPYGWQNPRTMRFKVKFVF